MIESITTKENHVCDLCKRRIPSTSQHICKVCKKEICCYCSIRLIRSTRKNPDSGYSIVNESIGCVCQDCLKKKLGISDKERMHNVKS